MEMFGIGDFVIDNSCAYPVIDMVSGVRKDAKGTYFKMKASGLYVSADKVEKVGVYND